MKYIRTKEGIQALYIDEFTEEGKEYYKNCKIADTIEELCDKFVGICGTAKYKLIRFPPTIKFDAVYGAIWTDKGLIYVAKMNDKGGLELL